MMMIVIIGEVGYITDRINFSKTGVEFITKSGHEMTLKMSEIKYIKSLDREY